MPRSHYKIEFRPNKMCRINSDVIHCSDFPIESYRITEPNKFHVGFFLLAIWSITLNRNDYKAGIEFLLQINSLRLDDEPSSAPNKNVTIETK